MKKIILLAIVLLCRPMTSKAETSSSCHTLTVVGGGYAALGFSGGIQYAYFPKSTPALGIGIDVSRIPNQLEWHSNTVMALAEMRLARPKGRWRPFIFSGFGIQRTHNRIVGGPWGNMNSFGNPWPDTGIFESRTLADDSDTSWAAAWGVGTEFYLTDRIYIGSELRQTVLGPTYFRPTEAGRLIGANTSYPASGHVDLMFRVGLKFGPGGLIAIENESDGGHKR